MNKKAALAKWEGSKEDRAEDRAGVKKMQGKCKCGKTLKGGRCPGCKNTSAKCTCGKKS